MNNVVTSKEAILEASKNLIKENGWPAVNIRAVAATGGISVGSIYNYFSSKTELIAATVESVWCEIFSIPEQKEIFSDFLLCIDWIFDSIKKGNEKYPGFFTLHAMSFLGEEKECGQQLMKQAWEHIKNGLCTVLANDKKIRSEAFDEVLTIQKFVDTIFSFIVSSLLLQNYDCAAIKEIVRRTIY